MTNGDADIRIGEHKRVTRRFRKEVTGWDELYWAAHSKIKILKPQI